MKTSPIVALGVASFLGVLPSQTQTCASLDNVQITFFGYPDNSPPGAGIAWTDCGHSLAGGTGSYDDPITFATAPDGDFQVCDIVYLPYLRKYARYEDDCEQCTKDWDSSHEYHIDLWTGSTTTNGGDAQINCENNLPGGPQTILRNPASDLPTDTSPFFSNGDCNQKTYDVASGGDVCSAPGGGASPSSKTATTLSTSTTKKASKPTTTAATATATTTATCAWEGHCAGAPCKTYNDCSDPFVCTGGKCANS